MAALFFLFLRALIFTTLFRFCTANSRCIQELGTGINPQHCDEAMKNFHALSSFHSAGGSIHDDQWFSRNLGLVDTFRHLPKAFVFKTCSIGIDLSDHPHPPSDDTGKRASWAVFAEELQALIKSCPGRHGWGGIAAYRDFEFVIVNPAAGIAQGTCLTPHRPQGMSLSACIERQVWAKQQQVHQQTQAHSRPPPVMRIAQHAPSQFGAQQPPLSDPQVHGGAGPSTAQPPASRPPVAQQLAELYRQFQSARQYQGGQRAIDDHLRQQTQSIIQQMPNTVQVQAHDRAQQEGDRRAQRQAVSALQPRPQMAGQQQPPHSHAFAVAPLQLGQQRQGSNLAWLMGRPAQQPQPAQLAAQATGSDSPTPGSPSTITENSSSRPRRGGSEARSQGADS